MSDIARLQEMIGRSAFHQLFRPQVLVADTDTLTLSLKAHMSATLERQPGTGQWHGGAVSALVDTVGCYALALLSEEPLPTVNFRTDYLRPGVETDLVVNAIVRRAGRTIGVVDVDVLDNQARLVAVGRASYSMVGGLKPR